MAGPLFIKVWDSSNRYLIRYRLLLRIRLIIHLNMRSFNYLLPIGSEMITTHLLYIVFIELLHSCIFVHKIIILYIMSALVNIRIKEDPKITSSFVYFSHSWTVYYRSLSMRYINYFYKS